VAQENPMTVEFSAIPGIAENTVMVSARGTNKSRGYVCRMEESPHEPFPPRARLFNEAPTGMVAMAITDFETNAIELATADGQIDAIVEMPDGSQVKVPVGHGPG
jgi:hypothetical protein